MYYYVHFCCYTEVGKFHWPQFRYSKEKKKCPKCQVTLLMFGRKPAGAEHLSHIFVESLGVVKNHSLDPVCNLNIILIHARNCCPGPHLSSCFYLNNPRNSGFFHLCSLQVSKAIRICFDSSTHLTPSKSILVGGSIPFPSCWGWVCGWAQRPCLVSIPSVLFIRLVSSTCLSVFHQSLQFSLFFIQWEKNTHYQSKYICLEAVFYIPPEKKKIPWCFQFINFI